MRPEIFGQHRDTRVVGRLLFRPEPDDLSVKLQPIKLDLWARTRWRGYRLLGSTVTDRDGRFDLAFDLRAARRWSIRSVTLELSLGDVVFHRVRILKADLVGMEYSVGNLRLSLPTSQPIGTTP